MNQALLGAGDTEGTKQRPCPHVDPLLGSHSSCTPALSTKGVVSLCWARALAGSVCGWGSGSPQEGLQSPGTTVPTTPYCSPCWG